MFSDVVLAVACHPDPLVTQIVSASKDSSVKVWAVSQKKQDSSELLERPVVCDDRLISD